jgi:formylglycine-generating enzyme required for sulfatase activity
VYPEGGVDSYEGERFRDVDAPFARIAPTERPRLTRDGLDVTPATEPSPLLTVDRLVLVRLRPGNRGRVQVLLHGACAGTMARLGPDGTPILGDAASCVATEKTRDVVAPSAADDDLTTPTRTAAGTWLAGTCPAPDPASETVCVPGGATVLGSRENSDYLRDSKTYFDSAPPRVYGLSPFFVDRDELTVGALKAVLARGYAGALPQAYEGVLAQPTATARFSGCTWSLSAAGRDDYPVTCASFRAARAICQFRGGDLPTEAQWEHLATVAGHPYKVRYPWGQELPTCERSVWGRVPIETSAPECPGGAGPRLRSEAQGDVSPLGIRDLFGGVSEWVLDDAAAFDSSTWIGVSIVDPRAEKPGARRILRGSSWMSGPYRPFLRFSPLDDEGYAPVGIRCVYGVKQP